MNILYAVTTMTRINGGVCTQILDLCTGLSNEKIVLVADGSDYMPKIESIPNVTFIQIPFFRAMHSIKDFLYCYRQMRKICKEYQIDIIHLHGQRLVPFAWMIKRSMKIPYLWTNHIDAIPHAKLFTSLARLLRFPIISVSTDLKNQLVNEFHLPDKQIAVVRNGVDVTCYPPLTLEEKAHICDKFHIGDGDYVISEVARLTYGKGQDLLVRAVHTVVSTCPNIHIKLLFAGTGHQEWFQHNVMEYACKHNLDCEYLGFQSPREVFGVSDLAVLPSFFEGFPLSCVEAMAMNCPVIRSNTPGHSDMTDITLIHQKGNIDQLVELLQYAIANPAEMKAMAKAGRRKCETVFNTEEMCRQTMVVYQKIIEGTF